MFLKFRQLLVNWLLQDCNIKVAGLKVGANTINMQAVGGADVLRWSAQTSTATQAGDLTMDTTSGRPHAYVDGYDHALSAWRGYFGSGFDGSATADGVSNIGSVGAITLSGGNYILNRDCAFVNLTINNGVSVLLDGYRLFVNGILTINGTVGVPGNNANGATGGAAINTGSIYGAVAGGNGGSSGAGPGNGSNGTAPANSYGGNGGTGGNGSGAGGGADGTGSSIHSPEVNFGTPFSLPELIVGAIVTNYNFSLPSYAVNNTATWTTYTGGGSGGGGGVSAVGTLGGGGGGGGGVVIIAARVIKGTGTITATGGNGGNASGSGIGDGGGGGGGGFISLIYGDKSGFSGIITVSGGSGGSAINGGHIGTAGSSGNISLLPA